MKEMISHLGCTRKGTLSAGRICYSAAGDKAGEGKGKYLDVPIPMLRWTSARRSEVVVKSVSIIPVID